MDSLCREPVCLWLPNKLVKPGTSVYVQGVEAPLGYTGPVPEGFDVIPLPAAEYLLFQGEPFREEDYCEAIEAVQHAIERYDPAFIGYKWDESGYIELKAVKPRKA